MKKVINSNYLLFIPLFLIMGISLLNMQNARILSDLYQYNLLKQIIFFIIGLMIIFIIKKLNTAILLKYSSA